MIRQHNKNGQPDQGVCDRRHTVHSDELFRLGNAIEMVQPDQGVCNGGHTVHSSKLYVLSQENRNVSHKQDVCNMWKTSNYIGG